MSDEEKYISLLQQDGALVLEGVAGVGKTFAIKAISQKICPILLRDLFTPQAVARIVRCNLGSPNGSRLVDEFKKNAELFAKCAESRTSVFVMHPSTSYEEMIGGLRPVAVTGNTAGKATPARKGTSVAASTKQEFQWMRGKLLHAIKRATVDLSSNVPHLVVLDEINRCNLPSVLGELIYLIEPGRRVTPEKYKEAQDSGCPTSFLRREGLAVFVGPPERPVPCFIPSNLYILGTMNSSDRSILGFDQALRRRFPPYRQEPLTVNRLIEELEKVARDLNVKIGDPLRAAINAWGYLNTLLRCVIGPDAMIGHSYWFNSVERHGGDPSHAWRFGVLPQAIHAAESARMERFLADIFGGKSSDLIDEQYVNPEDDENGNARLGEDFRGCFADSQTAMPAVSKMVEEIREMDAVVKLVGCGHGEKLIVVDRQVTSKQPTSPPGASAGQPQGEQPPQPTGSPPAKDELPQQA